MIDETGPVFEAWQDTVGVEGVGPVELRMAFDALKYGYTVGWERGHDDAQSETAALRARVEAVREVVDGLNKLPPRAFSADNITLVAMIRHIGEIVEDHSLGGTAEKESAGAT